jgi:pyruvate/2-oxoglutarate dehydrogenase complex dihydrolipoamide acyltransferase (E2) component
VSPERPGSQEANEYSSGSAGEQASFEQEYEGYTVNQNERPGGDPDVVLDVPVLNIDELDLEVEDLAAHVSVRAELADLVKVNVGVDVYLNNVKLEIKGVEAQALLKVRLERILNTLDRALDAIDKNPQILGGAARGADQTPKDASRAARDTGRMARLEEATPGWVDDLATEGAGDRLDRSSDQAGRAGESRNVTETTPSKSKEEVGGEEAKDSLAGLQIEEEYVNERGRIVGRARDASGNVIEEVLDEEGGVLDPGEPKEAEDSREREDDSNLEATEAARRRANETGVKLSGVKGTGSGGRILVKDVERAARTSAAG